MGCIIYHRRATNPAFDPCGLKPFCILNSTEHKILPANKKLNAENIKICHALKLPDVVLIMFIKC